MSPENRNTHDFETFKLLLTNARSLAPKIESLHNNFEAHSLDVALVTESWLKDGSSLEQDIVDLEHGTDLKIVYKNRPKKQALARAVGGGVSIIFNKHRCGFRERKITGNKFELVAAIGRVGKIPRQFAIFCIYIEPTMRVGELGELNQLLHSQILQLKSKGDPAIIIGGDLNRRSIDDAIGDFPDIKRVNFEPTRGNACLDVIHSNIDMSSVVCPPLQSQAGIASDHSCIIAAASVKKEPPFRWVKKTARKHTERAVEVFGAKLRSTNWADILNDEMGLDEMVAAYDDYISRLTDALFPLVTIKCRSNDPLWMTNGIRRMTKHKMRVFRREGKSGHWINLRDRVQLMVESSKVQLVNRTAKLGPKAYFRTIKSLTCKEKPPEWNLQDLFPGKSQEQAGEEALSFFTHITDTFTPLGPETQPLPADCRRAPVTQSEVALALKNANKPSSMVQGDMLPRLMKKYHADIVTPTTLIFNRAFETGRWPKTWKTETTVIIPKGSNPSSLAETRNISCTPFLSKVLESIMLGDLRRELVPDAAQYGGIKDCSVDHLLVDLFDRVLKPMENGNPSVILGIDYEKAFNRLDHNICLQKLKQLGASGPSIAMVRSFLSQREMKVKLQDGLTGAKPLNGGSPQGSILGCLLYCIATQHINTTLPFTPLPQSAEADPPSDDSDSEGSEDDTPGMDVTNWAGGVLPHNHSPQRPQSPPGEQDDGGDERLRGVSDEFILALLKYIDDTTTIEAVDKQLGVRHITTGRTLESIPGPKTGGLLCSIIRAAEEIGMKVNCAKTQLLVVAPDNGCTTTCTLNMENATIRSKSTMKLLGFMLGSSPGVGPHVQYLKEKFRKRFWALIHLRRSGIKSTQLFQLYKVLVRPILEVNSPRLPSNDDRRASRRDREASKEGCPPLLRHREKLRQPTGRTQPREARHQERQGPEKVHRQGAQQPQIRAQVVPKERRGRHQHQETATVRRNKS